MAVWGHAVLRHGTLASCGWQNYVARMGLAQMEPLYTQYRKGFEFI